MIERLRVGIAELRLARAPAILVSYGLGSCLGITLYDPELRLGGLAHTLLPAARVALGEGEHPKFVDFAVRSMAEALCAQGAAPERLVAKLAGGANMFAAATLNLDGGGIGQRNIQAARTVLAELAIPVVAEDVGGSCGRTIEFSLDNGELLVRSVRNNERRVL